MCKCKTGATGQCSCGSLSLRQMFKGKEAAIKAVFEKHGAGHLPPNAVYAGALANLLGDDFIDDMGEIIFPEESKISNADGKGSSKVKNFFKGLGQAVKGAVKNVGSAAVASIGGNVKDGNNSVNNAPVVAQQECPEGYVLNKEKGICEVQPKILGLTYTQAALVGLLIVGVVALLVISKNKK